MGDIADQAEYFEQSQPACRQGRRDNAIDKIVHRQISTPLVNSDGQRLCRDCECVIPFTRVLALPHVVRCYDCQVTVELHR